MEQRMSGERKPTSEIVAEVRYIATLYPGGHPPLSEAADRLAELEAELDELRWLMTNSEGVVGLNLDGTVMPWAEVRRLYAPSARGFQ
jgi:hypothetical protein